MSADVDAASASLAIRSLTEQLQRMTVAAAAAGRGLSTARVIVDNGEPIVGGPFGFRTSGGFDRPAAQSQRFDRENESTFDFRDTGGFDRGDDTQFRFRPTGGFDRPGSVDSFRDTGGFDRVTGADEEIRRVELRLIDLGSRLRVGF